MGKIICLMGKSSSGKDTIYKNLLEDKSLGLRKLIPYTTRPMREGEQEGVEYHFTDEAGLARLQEEDRVEYLGVNRQVFDYGPDSFLRLYRIGDFTFHIPCQKDEVNELEILDEEIDGEISAEKTRNVDINFRQAMLLLENYSGVKAAGTYNKKPEFY